MIKRIFKKYNMKTHINSTTILNNNNINNVDSNNHIIISLTTIPSRIINKNFMNVINKLYEQIHRPSKIIINIARKYKRTFDIDYKVYDMKITELTKLHFVYLNFIDIDYGPITKVLGLMNCSDLIHDNSIIIIVDDDWFYSDKLVLYYEMCYELYNSDFIGIDENNIIEWKKNKKHNIIDNKVIFYEKYNSFAYGWLSYSIKKKYIIELYEFYNNLLNIDNNIFFHDDLVVGLFILTKPIISSGINICMCDFNNRLDIEYIDALRINSFNMRNDLEEKFCKLFNIQIIKYGEHNRNKIINSNKNENLITININMSNIFEHEIYEKYIISKSPFINLCTLFNQDIIKHNNIDIVKDVNYDRQTQIIKL